MARRYTAVTFTDSVKEAQARYGSRETAAKVAEWEIDDERLSDEEAGFLAERDGFYMATVNEDGWPYVQFRGGPRGFLKVLDERVAARRAIRERYREAFAGVEGIELAPEAKYGESNGWLTCVLVDEERFGASSQQIVHAMAAQDIEVRPVWKPMHQQPYYAECTMYGGQVSDGLFARGLCLPSGSALTAEDQERVVTSLVAVGQAEPSG